MDAADAALDAIPPPPSVITRGQQQRIKATKDSSLLRTSLRTSPYSGTAYSASQN